VGYPLGWFWDASAVVWFRELPSVATLRWNSMTVFSVATPSAFTTSGLTTTASEAVVGWAVAVRSSPVTSAVLTPDADVGEPSAVGVETDGAVVEVESAEESPAVEPAFVAVARRAVPVLTVDIVVAPATCVAVTPVVDVVPAVCWVVVPATCETIPVVRPDADAVLSEDVPVRLDAVGPAVLVADADNIDAPAPALIAFTGVDSPATFIVVVPATFVADGDAVEVVLAVCCVVEPATCVTPGLVVDDTEAVVNVAVPATCVVVGDAVPVAEAVAGVAVLATWVAPALACVETDPVFSVAVACVCVAVSEAFFVEDQDDWNGAYRGNQATSGIVPNELSTVATFEPSARLCLSTSPFLAT
jgi:hypothetical protein